MTDLLKTKRRDFEDAAIACGYKVIRHKDGYHAGMYVDAYLQAAWEIVDMMD